MAKSENLNSLAEELRLGLESFIFIDDNELECAEVRARCPEVLVLQIPRRSERIPRFLRNIWAFDSRPTSTEDSSRVEWYRTNTQRADFHARTLSLKDFIDGLQLRVDITAVKEDEIGRVSQLTFRTNQFNFTARQRSESEIRSLLRDTHRRCLVARVTDRFGHYGL